ncbi:HAMP domain-containing protein [Leptospira gomenensis]|uniref:HAMP domain-containing protein n=1 Tax=Leptospira gomenensis TaxID=2484974 RepID=A0A5F1Y6Q3_9LEPT|nr:SpoIIE family protein phosphatase [Leptospira gomenensis]TGK27916.1 HAMP domain-containing protein [Leptospira gomenensis]TGK45478.1 HAMP domain-containing protein [Leptospira gomenensis]TGK45865.1 HAMP domain-containing protein [Leptospira gomenensis]TGK65209.1 HAMP domain-containing protein [Leptospira gomenensis]
MDSIYLNYFSLASLVGVLFIGFTVFFFFSIQEKASGTLYLCFGLLWLGIFHLGYMVGFPFYGPWSVFHRWIVIPSPFLGLLFLIMFFFHYPEPVSKKVIRTGFILAISVILAMCAWYFYESFSAKRVFYFSGHYWDFQINLFYKVYSAMVLVYTGFFMGIGIWRMIKLKAKDRIITGIILIPLSIITLFPGVLNAMSRDGAVSRELYQTVLDISLVIGLFVILVGYINYTSEKTSILARIIGITLATFFLVLQIVSLFIFNEYETSYDLIKRKEARLSVSGTDVSKDVVYVFRYDPENDTATEFLNNVGIQPNVDVLREFRFFKISHTLFELPSLPKKVFLEKAEGILANSPPDYEAYRAGLKEFLADRKEENLSGTDVELFFETLEKKLVVLRNKFFHLPPKEKNDSSALEKLFHSETPGLSGFLKELKRNALHSSVSDTTRREKIIQSLLTQVRKQDERTYKGERIYELGGKIPKHFISYFYVSPDGKIYDVGFRYESLREFLHSTGKILYVSALCILLLVLVGFRFFFQGALLNPLEDVVIGLREANSGNLEYRLQVKVEDEIGFIARSFNRMARSIQAAKKRLQQYADELEEKVQERTKELQQTLEEVRELKQQQDGDYFLTSLLIKPLGSNKARQENVKVDFLIEQKKKFSFRRFNDEIGGDINISNFIELQDRYYTVFLNADAMGKSMQGAGGALVLGAVFESIIERTRMAANMKEQSPERWLKNAFLELHKVFESFDGSMLVSLVLGVVDDDAGLLYFINAEHPWTVLYRDGIASFIEDDLMFRKLGTTGMEGTVFIKTFQMEPGDIIIAGSDGRDDLLVGTDQEGGRIINDDEKLFLRQVEDARGELQSIYEGLKSHGSLTDDLSLVRVSFKESLSESKIAQAHEREQIRELLRKAKDGANNKELEEAVSYLEQAESLNNQIPEVKKLFVSLFLKKKDYRNAALYAEDYLNLKPVDKEILYIASTAARRSGSFQKALDFGERLRLREPTHLKNIINLAQVYIALKNYKRAMEMVDIALSIDPNHEVILKIQDVLRRFSQNVS